MYAKGHNPDKVLWTAKQSLSISDNVYDILGDEISEMLIQQAHDDIKTGAYKIMREAPQRYRLPVERTSITHKFTVAGVRCYLIVGMYEDGMPGEIFLKVDKVGSISRGLADSFSCLFSIALQHGIPLQYLVKKFSHTRFEPAGLTDSKVKELKITDSIVDYAVRWLEYKFVHGYNIPGGETTQDCTTLKDEKCPHGHAISDPVHYPGISGTCLVCRGQLP